MEVQNLPGELPNEQSEFGAGSSGIQALVLKMLSLSYLEAFLFESPQISSSPMAILLVYMGLRPQESLGVGRSQ